MELTDIKNALVIIIHETVLGSSRSEDVQKMEDMKSRGSYQIVDNDRVGQRITRAMLMLTEEHVEFITIKPNINLQIEDDELLDKSFVLNKYPNNIVTPLDKRLWQLGFEWKHISAMYGYLLIRVAIRFGTEANFLGV
jgi:predicted P-loop ATPase